MYDAWKMAWTESFDDRYAEDWEVFGIEVENVAFKEEPYVTRLKLAQQDIQPWLHKQASERMFGLH